MQCNITFDLDSPEDAAHHLRCTKALDLALCLNEFNTQLLSQLKYDELSGKEKILLSRVNEYEESEGAHSLLNPLVFG